MANSTPNMGLVLNVVGTTTDPLWSENINTDFTTIDMHDHAAGSGVNITPAGMNINTDLSFNFNNITSVRAWRMQNNASVLSASLDINCGYFVNGNFYINNNAGTPVQITNGAGLNFSSLGTIGGDYGQPGITAAVTYTNSNTTYSFTSSSGIYAIMATGPLAVANVAAASQPITINAPSTATSYTYTLPPSIAVSQSVLASDTSGTGSFLPYTSSVTASTLVLRDSSGNISGNQISGASLATNSIVPPSGTVTITGAEIVSSTLISQGLLTANAGAQVNGTLNVSSTLTCSADVVASYGVFATGLVAQGGTMANVKFATFTGTVTTGNSAAGVVPNGQIYNLSGQFTTGGVSYIPIGTAGTNTNWQFSSPGTSWSFLNNTGFTVTYYILAMYV